MKFDILLEFRKYLRHEIENKHTADKYYFSVLKILREKQFNSLGELDANYLKDKLSKIKTKNNFSSTKNGLLYLSKFDKELNLPEQEFFKSTSLRKRNWTLKPPKTLHLDTIKRKVNSIRNDKLKLAYRIMMVSGLRVSEIAGLEKQDITIDGENITVNVRYGKGGSNGLVKCMKDPYLLKKLESYMLNKHDNKKIFYSSEYMKKKAGELDLECHDFRRIAAIIYKKEQLKDIEKNADTANEETKQFLRHSRFATTKRYLFNRKLKFERKKIKKE